MQPLVLHPPSLTTAQFGQPRFNSGPERLPLNRPWPSNARGYSPRDPPPVNLCRAPCRPKSPRIIPTPGGGECTSTGAYSTVAVWRKKRTTTPAFGGSPRPVLGAPPYLPLSTVDPSIAGPPTRSLAQKSTRRTKAHVASACVNCKKKHLGCDPARPCRRCVLAGKASSCVDVTHKKRGRPPLKAEDSSLRSYSTPMDSSAVPAEAQPSAASQRTAMHRATSSRELRPMTDLQGISEPGPASAAMRVPRGGQSHRWSASVFPLSRPMDPSPSIPAPVGRRPFSASGPPNYAPPAPPPPAFVPITAGFNPVLKPGTIPPGMERRFPLYASPALPPPTSPSQHHPPGLLYSPYAEPPSNTMHQPLSDPRIPQGPREPYLESPVRLPPIYHATASPGPPPPPHHAHRLSDPYPASWSSSGREDHPREPRSPAQRQPPTSSAFSHSPSHHRSSSAAGPLDPVPRHLGLIDFPSPGSIGHSLSAPTRVSTNPTTEAESQEPRPVKRRKMALDDMVNG
ncbi:uncharacterized protein N7482_006453 [Penicillium canariense]|uniref:Zn(2)-C6 fungal-type domain-containing protein n=1 Tax=Penicillium canariense TaxID=189055 RepID=A0A9W9HUK9_9EURO|nr:uncharacterized protein N7482_006453 [Penicillium canariense]KAJ5159449.1 hypothetical protein N7482_006453 [Penicillium canariense]